MMNRNVFKQILVIICAIYSHISIDSFEILSKEQCADDLASYSCTSSQSSSSFSSSSSSSSSSSLYHQYPNEQKRLILDRIREELKIVKQKSDNFSHDINITKSLLNKIKNDRKDLIKSTQTEIDKSARNFKTQILDLFSNHIKLDPTFIPNIRKFIAILNILSGKDAIEATLQVTFFFFLYFLSDIYYYHFLLIYFNFTLYSIIFIKGIRSFI